MWAATYESYLDLVGSAPYAGEKIKVLSTRNYPGGWAVAGNPILWCQPYVRGELERVNANDDWSFGILNEIGIGAHDYQIAFFCISTVYNFGGGVSNHDPTHLIAIRTATPMCRLLYTESLQS